MRQKVFLNETLLHTYIRDTCHTYIQVTSQIYMSQVTHMHTSRRILSCELCRAVAACPRLRISRTVAASTAARCVVERAVCCSVLQCVAARCSVLQCVAVC